jgi:hypothetical protein
MPQIGSFRRDASNTFPQSISDQLRNIYAPELSQPASRQTSASGDLGSGSLVLLGQC